MKIVIAGGSGFLGKALTNYFVKKNIQVTILSRKPRNSNSGLVKEVYWDGKTLQAWGHELEGAEALINLSGKSVDCRYTEQNKQQIYSSRLASTQVLGDAVLQCIDPPKVWLNSSSATIYRGSYDKFMDERHGEIGHDFSMDVCKKWEAVFDKCITPRTRKVILRTSIVLDVKGGALVPLLKLVKAGLGGKMGSGKQYFSWIHIHDFCRINEWLIQKPAAGIYNVCSPQPVPNADFMKALRHNVHVRVALPLPVALLTCGAALIRTETELVLKSRKVYPQRLLDEEFVFEFPDLKTALEDLCQVEAKIN
jgi:uncharacterized protein (TIGR01777 family)